MTTNLRAGDSVLHRPSGERWLLAAVGRFGDVYPAGWPATRAEQSDCELIERCTDEEHRRLIFDLCRAPKDGSDMRHSLALDVVTLMMGRGEDVPADIASERMRQITGALADIVRNCQAINRQMYDLTSLWAGRTRPAWMKTRDVESSWERMIGEIDRLRDEAQKLVSLGGGAAISAAEVKAGS